MISKQGILQLIHEDWGQRSQSRICADILDYLINSRSPNSLYLTYGSLRRIIKIACEDSELLTAVQYLCGDKIHLLEVKFELIENDKHIEITDHEIIHARTTGQLIHPESGESIDNFEERVCMYFQPSSLVQGILQ
jgi:predicted metallopeptidase